MPLVLYRSLCTGGTTGNVPFTQARHDTQLEIVRMRPLPVSSALKTNNHSTHRRQEMVKIYQHSKRPTRSAVDQPNKKVKRSRRGCSTFVVSFRSHIAARRQTAYRKLPRTYTILQSSGQRGARTRCGAALRRRARPGPESRSHLLEGGGVVGGRIPGRAPMPMAMHGEDGS